MCNHGISLSFKTGFSYYHSLSSESPFFFLTANNLGIYPDAEGTSLLMSLASDHDLYTVSSLYCSFIIFICLQQILFLDQNRVPSSPFHLCSKNTNVQPGQSDGGRTSFRTGRDWSRAWSCWSRYRYPVLQTVLTANIYDKIRFKSLLMKNNQLNKLCNEF